MSRWRRRASLCSANESTQGSNKIHSKGKASSFHPSVYFFFLSQEQKFFFFKEGNDFLIDEFQFFVFSFEFSSPFFSSCSLYVFLLHLFFIWISMFSQKFSSRWVERNMLLRSPLFSSLCSFSIETFGKKIFLTQFFLSTFCWKARTLYPMLLIFKHLAVVESFQFAVLLVVNCFVNIQTVPLSLISCH